MKRVTFVLAMLYACISGICTPVYAIRSGIRMVANSFLKSLDTDDHDDQKLFEELRQKMGLGDTKISLVPVVGYASQTAVCQVPVDYVKGSGWFYGLSLDFSESDCCLPRNQRAFILAHELAHIKNGDINTGIKKEVMSHRMKKVDDKNTDSRFQEKEKRADLVAITVLKDKSGALEYFKRECKENLECKNKIREFLCSKKKREDYVSIYEFWNHEKLSEKDKNIVRFLVEEDILEDALESVDEEGNCLTDTRHPFLTERIAYCNAALQDPTLCTIQCFPHSRFQFDSAQSEKDGLKAIIVSANI